jgi:hypothetical protein
VLAGGGGCAAGAPLRVLCAWGPGGAGAGPASAMGAVLAAAGAGAPVTWWAGGGPDVPLRARLTRRTAAVVAEASVGCVVFPASPAVARGLLPVVAFPLGFPVVTLPELGGRGLGACMGPGVWARAWRWVSTDGCLIDFLCLLLLLN